MRPLLLVSLVFMLVACSKEDTPTIAEMDTFSWAYNGRSYHLIVKNNIANAGALIDRNRVPAISFDMVDELGGAIYFKKACAYLAPLGSIIHENDGCGLTERDDTGTIIPIDSTKVYLYQSGSFNISVSNCTKKTAVDVLTGQSYQYDDCSVSGTFDLTVVNKEDATIKITDGIVILNHVVSR